MKARFALLMMMVVLAPLPAAPQTLPDSQTLRERSDAAYGAVPDNFRQTIEFAGTAGSGKRIIYRRGSDRREVRNFGPIHTEFGTYKGDHWHENGNGHVVIDQADPGLATGEATVTTVAHVNAPVDAYVIARLNSKGFGVRDFIDPTTYYVVRREERAPNGTTTTTYDDFRAFGTRHLAGHWTIHDETTATETRYETRDYVAGDVTDSDVAMPANARQLVEYPAGQNRIVLPAVFEPSGHIVVRLTMAGRGLDYILDTGASTITLDPGVAAQFGLPVIGKMQSSVNAGRFTTGFAVVPRIDVGPLTMRDTIVSIAPLGFEEPGVKVVGLLGFDFICESGITIDYENKTVTAERYGTYMAPADPAAIALDVRLGTQIPLTSVNINGNIAERTLIDTGAVGPFLLFDYFQRRHPDALGRSGSSGATVRMSGLGGAFDARLVELDDLKLGNVSFKRFDGYLVTSPTSYANAMDALIGPSFLRFFDLHVDYPNGEIYLVPNATGHRFMRT